MSGRMRAIDWGMIVLLMLVATLLRFMGLSFGLPKPERNRSLHPMIHINTTLHPDEYFYVSIPYTMLAKNQLYPGFYENPSFLIYLNRFVFGLTGAHNGADVARWERERLNNRLYAPFPLYVIGRTFSALGGLVAVAATYAAAKLVAGRYGALLAGLLAAVSLPLVQHAHYSTTSSLAAGCVALCLWGCCASLKMQHRKWVFFIIAGIAAGLAAGNRYNAAAISISVCVTGLLFLVQRPRWSTLLTILVGYAAFPIVFLMTTPGYTNEAALFQSQFEFIYARYAAVGDESWRGLWNEYRYIVLLGLGIPAAGLALQGLAALFLQVIRRWQRIAQPVVMLVLLVIPTFIIPYSLVVLRTPAYPIGDQLTVPFLPALMICAAFGLTRWQARIPGRALPVVMLLVLMLPLLPTLLFVARLNQPDTRELLQDWIYAHLPRGSNIHLSGSYNIVLDMADYPTTQDYGYETGVAGLQAQGIDYLVVSDAPVFFLSRISDPHNSDVIQRTYQFNDLPLLAEVPRWHWWLDNVPVNNAAYWHQPGLRVFCLNPAACAIGS